MEVLHSATVFSVQPVREKGLSFAPPAPQPHSPPPSVCLNPWFRDVIRGCCTSTKTVKGSAAGQCQTWNNVSNESALPSRVPSFRRAPLIHFLPRGNLVAAVKLDGRVERFASHQAPSHGRLATSQRNANAIKVSACTHGVDIKWARPKRDYVSM